MKKSLKITLVVVGGIILLFIFDLICIFTIHRPLFAIKKENGTIYKGLLYDTYICEEYSIPQIKAKGTKFICHDVPQKEQEANNKEFDFYITKEEHQDDIKFNNYLTFSDRKYYLAGNIKEFYVIDGESMILKSYITNFNHTLDNPSIDKITTELTEKEILKDGGTTIYKSKDKDITIIECKTIDGNDDIFIGDYSMNFDNESMCK